MEMNGKITAGLSLVIIILMGISGCTSSRNSPSPVEFTLRFENIHERDVNGTMLYDILISVDEKDPEDHESLWMNIRVWIDIGQGIEISAYYYHPEKYDHVPRDEPQVFYEEITGYPDQIDMMDAFTLTGLDESYENGLFMVFYGGHDAGTLRLPADFS
ncbi:MAG: hypothetical protein ACMUIG_10090 [Thermoplasmatota archaeon]